MQRTYAVSAIAAAALIAPPLAGLAGACGGGGCKDAGACGPGKGGKEACAAKSKACGAGAKSHEATISTAGVKALIDSGTAFSLFDARSGKWDDGKRIPGAKSLNDGSSEEEIAAALPEKDALVVTYCGGVKCPASAKLAAKLKDLGYNNVVEYPEGIAGWTESGNAVDQAAE